MQPFVSFAGAFAAVLALAGSPSVVALSTRTHLRARRTINKGADGKAGSLYAASSSFSLAVGSQEYAEAKRASFCTTQQANGTNPYKYVLDQCVMVQDVTMPQDYHGKMKAQMTLDICYDYCRNYKSFYMGVKGGDECWCANSYQPNVAFYGAHVCHEPCPGDKNEYCGGKKDGATAVYIISDVKCEGRKPPEEGAADVNRRLGKAEDKLQAAIKQAKKENDEDNKKIEVQAMEELDAAIYDVEEGVSIPDKKNGRINAAKKAVDKAEELYNEMESFDDRREPPAKIVDALDHLKTAKEALNAGDLAKGEEEMEIAIGRNMPTRAAISPPPFVNDGRVSFKIPGSPDMYLGADPNGQPPFEIRTMSWKGDKSLVARLAFVGTPGQHAGDLKLPEPPAESFVFRGSEGILEGRALRARGPVKAQTGGGIFADDAKNPCPLFKEDVTFFFVEPEFPSNPPNPFIYSLRSFNFPDRFLRHHPDGKITLDRQPIGMTAAQEKEFTFEVAEAPKGLPSGKELVVPGAILAFHNDFHNKYMKMTPDGKMTASAPKGADELPDGWTWERFRVVDGGNGEVALWSDIHKRFVRLNDKTDMDTNKPGGHGQAGLPRSWTWERFEVVDAGGGQIAFHNRIHDRFVRLSGGDMDASAKKAAADLPPPDEWTWERFTVVEAGDPGGNLVGDNANAEIKNIHGICLDASERSKKGGRVHMWSCDANNKNQQWRYDPQTKQIKNPNGICLDASQRSKRGGKVHMWSCDTNNKNQQWDYDPGAKQIKNAHGICLDASRRGDNGGKVHMWSCDTNNQNQQWSISNVKGRDPVM